MTQLRQAAEQVFVGGSEMALLMRSYDWSQTPLGAVETWTQSLRSTLSICLNSRFPIAIHWGADFLLLYNDAWRPIVEDKHPLAIALTAYTAEGDQQKALQVRFQTHITKPVDPEALLGAIVNLLRSDR